MYYRLSCDSENYRNYILKENERFEMIDFANLFDGRPHKSDYQLVHFVMTVKSEIKYPVADIFLGPVPICSERAKDVILSICAESEVEFLPCGLEGVEEQYYIFNVLGTTDCVDYESSIFHRFPSSGRIMLFEYIQFNKEIDKHIFRIEDLKRNHYFVDEKAKELLEKAGLKGLEFDNSMFVKK